MDGAKGGVTWGRRRLAVVFNQHANPWNSPRTTIALDGTGIADWKWGRHMKLFWTLMLVGWSVLALAAQDEAATEAATEPVKQLFPDPQLEAVVRHQVFAKRATQEPLTAEDVANVAVLQGNFRGIADLTGLEHCRSLASVDLAGNRIVDLTPLKNLRRLQFVNLASNRVHEIGPLGTLPALQYIQLEHNSVTDLEPLAACTNLASVYVSHNKVRSIAPLTRLPRLVTLYADGNQVSTLEGLEALRGLTLLSVGNNHVADLTPLKGIRAPSFIRITTNRIADLKPFHEAAMADMDGPRNWAPFVRIYMDGNPLSEASEALKAELQGAGVRFLK